MAGETRADLVQQVEEQFALLNGMPAAVREDSTGTTMDAVLKVYAALARWGTRDPAEAQAFGTRMKQAGVEPFLLGERAQSVLGSYASDGELYALRGRTDGYLTACQHRTAVQALQDDFPGVVSSAWAVESMDDFDEALRDVADDPTPMHRGQIPSWAPKSHWWWWQPEPVAMDMREFGDRLYAGDLGRGEPGSADWLRCGDKKCWCYTAPG